MDTKPYLPFTLRRMEPRDIPHVVALDRMVFKDPWPKSAYVYELYFNPNARYFVLQMKGYPIPGVVQGFVGMRVEQGRGHISTLGIHPEWRGQGFGELLFIRALQQAIKMHADSVALEVRVTNKVAQNLYFKYGFVALSRFPSYYEDGEDAFQLELGLAKQSREYPYRLNERQHDLEAQITQRLTITWEV